MPGDWLTNKCGGVAYRTLEDARIELQGVGVPEYLPGSLEHKQLEQTWHNFKRHFRSAARREGIPVSHIVAIAAKETGKWSDDRDRQATIGSSAGAMGVMQIMPCKIVPAACPIDRQDPGDSISVGAKLLASHLRAFKSLPAAATAYNSGGVYCYAGATSNPAITPNQFGFKNEHDYSTGVVKFNNAAVRLGVNEGSLVPWIAGGAMVAVTGLWLMHRYA